MIHYGVQVLINLETFYALIQEIQLVRESQQVTLMELIVSPPAMEFIELQKVWTVKIFNVLIYFYSSYFLPVCRCT